MKKSKTLRLHRQHDLDLITLYRADGFSFSKEVRNILVAYVNQEPYEPPEISYEDVDLGYVPTTIQYHLTLNPDDPREQAVLDMLHNEIKYGYANAFVKVLIRAYIPRIPFIGYGVANGFVTRHITANDIGMRMREAQKTEHEKVEAETLTAKDIVPGIDDSTQVQSVPTFTSQEESVSAVSEPKYAEPINSTSIYTETEKSEQPLLAPEASKSEDDEDEDDEDDFRDFFKAAQSFTGV
jgi:hypothetical protein